MQTLKLIWYMKEMIMWSIFDDMMTHGRRVPQKAGCPVKEWRTYTLSLCDRFKSAKPLTIRIYEDIKNNVSTMKMGRPRKITTWENNAMQRMSVMDYRKRRLIKGYKLSSTTGLLYAWSSFMQWGVWVRAVGHWVVLVQVIQLLFQRGMSYFSKEPTAALKGGPELQPQS